MQYETAAQMAERLNVNIRTVQIWAKEGKLTGAVKQGRDWLIPQGEGNPNKSHDAKHMAMPRKSPFLDMTDLYHTPGKADECADALFAQKEAQALFKAEIAYSRGEIDKVYEYAQYFLEERSDFYAVIAGGMLLALCAMWRGDIELWRKAKQHICEAPWKTDNDRDIIALSLASSDSSIRDTDSFPDWFCRGCFGHLPKDAHPAARVFYIKYLMVSAQELAKGNIELDGVKGLGLMRTLPYIIEPMITQAVVDKTVMVEIYLRLLCAVAYHDIGDEERAKEHIDKTLQLALPDMMRGSLQNTNYNYSEGAMDWIEEKLAQIGTDKTVLFTAHFPLGDSNNIIRSSKGAAEGSTLRLLDILKDYPNLVYLYGHDHGSSFAFIDSETEERVTRYDADGYKMN